MEALVGFLPQLGGLAGIGALLTIALNWRKSNHERDSNTNEELWKLVDDRKSEIDQLRKELDEERCKRREADEIIDELRKRIRDLEAREYDRPKQESKK